MKKSVKAAAKKCSAAFDRNIAAYSGGKVVHEEKNNTRKLVTERLFKASRLDVMQEARRNNAKTDPFTLR
jgi:hypothetical protein